MSNHYRRIYNPLSIIHSTLRLEIASFVAMTVFVGYALRIEIASFVAKTVLVDYALRFEIASFVAMTVFVGYAVFHPLTNE